MRDDSLVENIYTLKMIAYSSIFGHGLINGGICTAYEHFISFNLIF